MFLFEGPMIISKSWLNRAQVIDFFNPYVKLTVGAESDDVIYLREALKQLRECQLKEQGVFDLGLGGTSFRFFCFLVSRFKGEWIVKAHERLLERPQKEMSDMLQQLGVQCEPQKGAWLIKSPGWKIPDQLSCKSESSSQFVSGLLLSSWNLEKDMKITIAKPVTSFSYMQMTIELLRQSGMQLSLAEHENFYEIYLAAGAKASADSLQPEIDISSLFSIAAAAVVGGSIHVTNWSANTTQPDRVFLQMLQVMRIPFQLSSHDFQISRCETWNGLSADLQNCPDLFPVLAVLCALAEGRSHLYGASQLKHKESDRIAKTSELLRLTGYSCEELHDGLKITGRGRLVEATATIGFDPAHDHRMAMAAAVLKLAGHQIEITDPSVVQKSYPDFWKDIGL